MQISGFPGSDNPWAMGAYSAAREAYRATGVVPTIPGLSRGTGSGVASRGVWSPPPSRRANYGRVLAHSGLGGWEDILTAITGVAQTGLQTYGAIKMADAGYNMMYQSPPAGVTPNNPNMLPSGYTPIPGVSPGYAAQYTYPQVQPPANPLQQYMPYLLLGGAGLFMFMILRRK